MAFQAGIEQDQLIRFLQAGYVLQPKAMEFHAAAREADRPDGPTRIAMGGSRGTGKSHIAMTQAVVDDALRIPGLKVLFLRSVGRAARESFGDLVRKALNGIDKTYKPSLGVMTLPNGSVIVLGGFRNESDIDNYLGIEYDLIVIEDASLLTGTKRTQIRGSLRTSKTNWRPRIYETTNPGGIGHAEFKADYYDPWKAKNETDTRFIQMKVGDNRFINTEYKTYLESLTGFLKKAWHDGDFEIAAGRYYTEWDEALHVIDPFPIPRDWEFVAGMDYGWAHPTVNYVMTRSGEGIIYVVAEWAGHRLPVSVHAAGIRDSIATIPIMGGGSINYRHIKTHVAGSDVFAESRKDGGTIAQDYADEGMTLTMANTGRIQGAQLILKLLGNKEHGIPPKLKIFSNCAGLIECLPRMLTDPKRPEDVLKVDADENGEFGDDCFIAGTMIATDHGDIPVELIRPGDLVMTRAGHKPVKDVWVNSGGTPKPTVEVVLSSGLTLTGTPNHRVMTNKGHWTTLDALRYGDTILSLNTNDYYRRAQWLNQRRLSSMGLNSDDIQMLKNVLIEFTTRLGAIIANEVLEPYIKRYGSRSMVASPQGMSSIILTAIRLITIYQISKQNLLDSIYQITIQRRLNRTLNILSENVNTWMRLDRLLPLGMGPKQGLLGIGSMGDRSLRELNQSLWCANSVERHSNPKYRQQNFAEMHASLNTGETIRSITSQKHARHVGLSSRSVSITMPEPAPVNVVGLSDGGRQVTYAIHVDEQHEYYANGVLVSNCYDSTRYTLMEMCGVPDVVWKKPKFLHA
jgi:hypothetical protein